MRGIERVPRRRPDEPCDLNWLFRWAIPEPNSGCWIFAGATNSGGYGSVMVDGVDMGAHCAAWLLSGRHVPDGFDLDHKCRVRCCFNPDHLEPVTRAINLARGIDGRKNRLISHCPQGHAYTPDNSFINTRGARMCRTCIRERSRANRRFTKKEAKAP